MAADPSLVRFKDKLSDFTADPQLLLLAAMASIIGIMGTAAAWLLLKMIAVFTNLAYYQRFSTLAIPFPHTLPLWTVTIPIVGGLFIGFMARFGSEKIRGHGIPEAIEAILIGQSRIAPRVALLKPLSSAISIGTGGPFGAEGPIIMTGGALGSLFAQLFHLSSAERKTLLVAGAAAGMTAVFGTPIAAILLAVELLLFEWKPRSFIPVAIAAMMAMAIRPFLIGTGPLFPYLEIVALPWWGLGLCLLAGIAAGLQSALMTLCLYGIEDSHAVDVAQFFLDLFAAAEFELRLAARFGGAHPSGDVFIRERVDVKAQLRIKLRISRGFLCAATLETKQFSPTHCNPLLRLRCDYCAVCMICVTACARRSQFDSSACNCLRPFGDNL